MTIDARCRNSRALSVLMSRHMLVVCRRLTELRRQAMRRPHTVSAFLGLDDPYSYLLAGYLPALADAYDIDLRCYLTQALGAPYRPRADLLAVYAENDCARVAAELGVPFLDLGNAPPVEYRRALVESLAAAADDSRSDLLDTLALYWRGDSETAARRVSGEPAGDRGAALLDRNQAHLVGLGHYNTAMLHYGGEWYWGVDRLHYLAQRLDELGQRRESRAHARIASIRQAMRVNLPVRPPGASRSLPALECFFSFRSPYSYIALRRIFAIADAFGLELKLRPVLPMVMRGLRVPWRKLVDVGRDAAREARRLGLPFGRFTDPLGRGVERCMAVFYYALQEKRARDFTVHAGEAIFARGVDVATDKGMRTVTSRAGLFWPEVVTAMQSDDWRPVVESNRDSMLESGCWGVPTLRLGDFVVWGQDRDWLLVRHIEENCDSGEGILV